MKIIKVFAAVLVILCASLFLPAQDKKPANLAAAPPSVVLLVHRQVFFGKAAYRQKLEALISRACDRADAQRFWIDLESLTGEPEALSFLPFDSYEHIEQSDSDWGQFLVLHPDVERMKEDVKAVTASERRTIALRRDDLGYFSENIDLSEARFVQVIEVRLFPGRESDFAEAYRILADAHTRIQADTHWVVYEVDTGAPAPTFLVLRPMSDLKQMDDLLSRNESLFDAEGEMDRQTLQRITREAYAEITSTVYAVNPQMSHVSKEFAIADPDFWNHQVAGGKSDPRPEPASGAAHPK